METYDFTVTIGFRVTADNKYEALRAALDTERSLDEASIRASYGGTTMMRVKAPRLGRFRQTAYKLPEHPASLPEPHTTGRHKRMLEPLLGIYRVSLRWRDRQHTYTIHAPTRPRAIEQAKVKFYHEHSALGAEVEVLEVQQFDLTNSNITEV